MQSLFLRIEFLSYSEKDSSLLVSCSEDVETMFTERDRDMDGSLSFAEFVGQETQMEKAFRMMDKDGDGFVTKSEFKKVCKNLTRYRLIFLGQQITFSEENTYCQTSKSQLRAMWVVCTTNV